MLIRVKNVQERFFYVIETIQNNWSVRELKRQFDCGLFERLALSKEKGKVKELAEKGQLIAKPKLCKSNKIPASPYTLQLYIIHLKGKCRPH
jgi:predicted nuclease of restriction endonuclease-like (RecB) superfamily